MARLPRVIQKIFGSSAGAGELGKIGSLADGTPVTTTDPEVMQSLSNFLGGLYSLVLGNNSPAMQDINSLFFLTTRQIAYLMESGVAEWNEDTTYYIGNLVNVDGDVYKSLTDNNLNNDPTSDLTNWVSVSQFIGLKMPRPDFQSVLADSSQVVIPASISSPASVLINGNIYTNTTDLALDLDVSGVNGLDTGAKAADTVYYVYAVLPASGTTFRGVISISPPSTGPTGFSTNWSYLGSFITGGFAVVVDFVFSKGKFLAQLNLLNPETVTSSTASAFTPLVSILAKEISFRSIWQTVNAVADILFAGPDAAGVGDVHVANSATVANCAIGFWSVPVLTPGTIYAKTTSNSDDVLIYAYSWQENPMDYK